METNTPNLSPERALGELIWQAEAGSLYFQ